MQEQLFSQLSQLLGGLEPNSGIDIHIARRGNGTLDVRADLKSPDGKDTLRSVALAAQPSVLDASFTSLIAEPLARDAGMRKLEEYSSSIDVVKKQKDEAAAQRKAAEEARRQKTGGRQVAYSEPDRLAPEVRGKLFEDFWGKAVESKNLGDFAEAVKFFTNARAYADTDTRKEACDKKIAFYTARLNDK